MTTNKDAVDHFLNKLLKNDPIRENSERTYLYFEIEQTGFAGPNAWFKVPDGKESKKFLTYDAALTEANRLKKLESHKQFDFRIVELLIREKVTYLNKE